MGAIISLREHFVGRVEEIAALSEAFERAAAGHTTTIALDGEAGVGKSRLVTEFFERIAERAHRTARGTCIENLRAPFLPVIEVLQALGLERTVASLPDEDPSPVRASQERQVRWFREVLLSLRDAPPNRPYVVNIEDVQWADAATLSFLEYLAGTRTDTRLLVVLTVRTEAFDRPGSVARTLARLRAGGLITIPLRPLDRVEMSELIRTAAPAPIPRASTERIKELAEGNPLFAKELLRAVLDDGQEAIAHPAFSSIRTTVLERFYQLGETDQQILHYAAVIGHVFDIRLVSRLMDLSIIDVLAGIRRARNVQLVREHRTGSHLVAFRHAVFSNVIYNELLGVEVRELHARVAAAIEETLLDEELNALAYHWTKAGDDEKALHYNVLAGDAAVRIAAYEDAARFYDEAFLRTTVGTKRHAELAEKRAYAWYAAGVHEHTDDQFATALGAYDALGECQKVVEMQLFISRQAWNDAETHRGYEHALKAVDLIGDADANLRDYALTMAATYAVHVGRPQEAFDLLARATPANDLTVAARRYDVLGIAHCRLGDAVAAASMMQLARENADRSGDPDLIVRVYTNSADIFSVYGDATAAREHWRRAFTVAQEARFIGRMAYAALGYAWACIDVGELEAAREPYATAVETGVANAAVVILESCVGTLIRALVDGRPPLHSADAAFALASRSRESLRIAQVGGAFALAAILRACPEEARDILDRAILAIETPHFAETLLLLGAIYASDPARTRACDLLEQLASVPGNVVARAAHDTLLANGRTGSSRGATLHVAAVRWRQLQRPLFERLALSLAGAVPASHRRGRAGGDLTPRELEIARLVAEGLSNRAISDRLGISERTVEHHVGSILSQLGIRSRWLVTPQLLETSL
jgi:DNA-binding CsgD family transcriptional regulator/tetratricopeptide (TPR) repeat protein